jgi:hypothetical protein
MSNKHRKRQIAEMEMQNVKHMGHAPDLLEQHQVRGKRVANFRIEPQRARPCRLEARARLRIPACEQRHVVSQADEGLGEIRHHAFRTAIQLWRNRFVQRGDLRDTHQTSPFRCFAQTAC